MGFRLRKSFKMAPGIRLNVSKSGVSTSIGRKGMTINVGRGKTRTTVGIPGTGISYSSTSSHKGGGSYGLGWLIFLAFLVLLMVWAYR